MKIALISNNKRRFHDVFSSEILEKLGKLGELSNDVFCFKDFKNHRAFLRDCEYIFATWGMEALTKEQIAEFFPSLKAVFYAAGSVQYFAQPFLDSGVRVFSAWKANAVPVAEFTFSQIVLAQKGYFQALRKCKRSQSAGFDYSLMHTGNYHSCIGLVGVGSIGSLVAERLKTLDCEVFGCDPFLSETRAKELNIHLTSLESIFIECDVISNHLANKERLIGVYNYELFRLMKPYATFINTGRGMQVVEADLARALREEPGRTALLDVLNTEKIKRSNPLVRRKNAFISPHIAGSMSNEVYRMSKYMLDEFERYLSGDETQYEVRLEMLETMA